MRSLWFARGSLCTVCLSVGMSCNQDMTVIFLCMGHVYLSYVNIMHLVGRETVRQTLGNSIKDYLFWSVSISSVRNS